MDAVNTSSISSISSGMIDDLNTTGLSTTNPSENAFPRIGDTSDNLLDTDCMSGDEILPFLADAENGLTYGLNELKLMITEQHKCIAMANNTLFELMQNGPPELKLQSAMEARLLSQTSNDHLSKLNDFLLITRAERLAMVNSKTNPVKVSPRLNVPSASTYSIVVSLKDNPPIVMSIDEVVTAFKLAIKNCTDPVVQIVGITKGTTEITFVLLDSDMVDPALRELNKSIFGTTKLNTLLDFSTITKSKYAIRTDKIPSALVNHWIGQDGKPLFATISNELSADNHYWFPPGAQNIEAVDTWIPKHAPDHRVFLFYVSAETYDKFLSASPSTTAVMIGTQSVRIYEEVNPVICFNCLQFGHVSSDRACTTPGIKICWRCAESHRPDTCNATSHTCANCVRNNSLLNNNDPALPYSNWKLCATNHSPFYNGCQTKKLEKDKLRSVLKKAARERLGLKL